MAQYLPPGRAWAASKIVLSDPAALAQDRHIQVKSATLKPGANMTPKILPSLLMAAGSLILAWRVKSLLDVLILAQLGTEANFRSINEYLADRQADLPMLVGFDQHVSRSRQVGASCYRLSFDWSVRTSERFILWSGF
jgi:hypothetical protein